MSESFFEEMKRYVRFGAEDGEALRQLLPHVTPRFRGIADTFYARLAEHDQAHQVFSDDAQIERLKGSLCLWLDMLFRGPWDEAYYERRVRIGRMHVVIHLPQRYMFGAMNLIRLDLIRLAEHALGDSVERQRALVALDKVLDLELAIILESYREAFVARVRELEERDKDTLRRRLAVSEARYEEIVERSEALVTTLDAAGRILLFNRRCEALTGWSRSEVLGQPWIERFARPRDRALIEVRLADVQVGARVPSYEAELVRPDGATARVRWHFTTLLGGQKPILCVLGIDEAQTSPPRPADPSSPRREVPPVPAPGSASASPALPVEPLALGPPRAQADGPGSAPASKITEPVAHELHRLAQLVENFVAFARPQPLRVERGDLRATAAGALESMQPEATAAGVGLRLEDGAPVELAHDGERLRQALLHLIRNGIESTGRGGQVEVRVSARGDRGVIDVADDGHGLPDEGAPIFDPFWSTKPSQAGLGLSIVQRIVQDHGGAVRCERQMQRTVFTLELPRPGIGRRS